MMTASRESVAYEQYEERFPVPQEQKRNLRVAPTPRRRKKARVRPSLLGCFVVVAIAAAYILFARCS